MYRLFLLLVLLFASVSAIAAESTGLGDLLQQGWQAERKGSYSVALQAYSSALALRPDDPQLNLKVAELLNATNKRASIAPYLVKALDGLQKEPKCPVDLKMSICSALMGTVPHEWRGDGGNGRISPPPYTSLPDVEQKRLSKAFPDSWFFASKSDELSFRISIGETERAMKLMKEVVCSGSWQAPQYCNFTNVFPEAKRKEMADSWTEEGKKSGNVFLRLGALILYVQMSDLRAFKREVPQVVEALNGQWETLWELADRCRDINWAEEESKIRVLCAAHSEGDRMTVDLKALEKLMESGDRAEVTTKLRDFLIAYPDSYTYAFNIDNICKLLDRNWGDLLVEFLQPKMLEDVGRSDFRVNHVLINCSVFNQPRFDYWVKQVIGFYASDDAFCKSMSEAMGPRAAEDRVWYFEELLRLFPKNDHLRGGLAESYVSAGYPNRALPILLELVKKEGVVSFAGNEETHEWICSLWKAANGLGKLSEVTKAIWDQRESLPPSVALGVGEQWLDQKNAEEAQKWLGDLYKRVQAESSQSSMKERGVLWCPEAYALRLRALVQLGRKDEFKTVMAEAQKRHPKYPFHEYVGTNGVVEVDWGEEIRRESDSLKTCDGPGLSRIPCREIIKLAVALIKAGRAAEAASISASALPAHTQWRDGLPLAVAMLRDGAKAVVPFVSWLLSVSPAQQFASGTQDNCAPEALMALRGGDQQVFHALALVAALLAPDTGYPPSVMNDAMYSGDEDMEVLVPALSKRKLNRTALSEIAVRSGYRGDNPTKWGAELVASQTWSAAGLILNLDANRQTGPDDVVRWLVDELCKTQDWAESNIPLLSVAASDLKRRGMRAEADRILAVGLKYATDYQRKDLIAASVLLTGKPPSGAYVTDSIAWSSYAANCRNEKRTDEACSSAMRALRLAKTPHESLDALTILAAVDPNPMGVIVPEFESFAQGKHDCLRGVSELVFGLVQKDHKLASQAAPLLEKAVQCDYNYSHSLWQNAAETDLWAGRDSQAIRIMQDRINDDYGLNDMFAFVGSTEMSTQALAAVAQGLEKTLQSNETELSYIAGALSNTSVFSKGTDEGLAALGGILARRVDASQGVVPVKLLDACVNAFYELSRRSPASPRATADWYRVTEASIKKAARKPEDARAISEWLHKSVDRLQTTGMKDTETLKKLGALADSLR